MSLFSKKDEVNLDDLMELHTNMLGLLYSFIMYCNFKGLPCKITSLKEEAAGRVSRSHIEGRAADFSSRGFSTDDIDDFLIHFNKKYEDIAAISAKDLKPRALVYHRAKLPDGSFGAAHFHLQVKP